MADFEQVYACWEDSHHCFNLQAVRDKNLKIWFCFGHLVMMIL